MSRESGDGTGGIWESPNGEEAKEKIGQVGNEGSSRKQWRRKRGGVKII